MLEWMKERGIIIERLAEPAGMTYGQLSAALNGSLFATGLPHRVTPQVAERLTTAVHAVAEQISQLNVEWGIGLIKDGRAGAKYNPDCVDRIMALKLSLNVRPFLAWALGWSNTTYNNLLGSSSSKAYGNITAQICTDINEALVGLSAQMAAIEIIPDNDNSSN